MRQLLNIYKPQYVTPLQIIDALRLKYPEYKKSKIGYAGRLDPLAHGVLLLMVDEETKKREQYLDLPKTYEFEALFGLSTDTYDLLGLCKASNGNEARFENGLPNTSDAKRNEHRNRNTKDEIKNFITSKLGTHVQPYPPFSSKAVHGKPLHWWAKQKRLSEITIPTREITIYSFELLSTGSISTTDLEKKITTGINNVQGSFRQKEILENWERYFNSQSAISNQQFSTARFRISCSSGTYVRGLVHELGEQLGTGAVTTEIFRTKVGDYMLRDSLRL